MFVKICVLLSTLMSVFFYYNSDPMKCSFFLVLSLVFVAPVLCLGYYMWCGYYVCLVFLSGVFVILVYFSSLSEFSYFKKPFWFFFLVVGIFVGEFISLGIVSSVVGVSELYFDFYLYMVFYVVLGLFFFLFFVSYCLSIGGFVRTI